MPRHRGACTSIGARARGFSAGHPEGFRVSIEAEDVICLSVLHAAANLPGSKGSKAAPVHVNVHFLQMLWIRGKAGPRAEPVDQMKVSALRGYACTCNAICHRHGTSNLPESDRNVTTRSVDLGLKIKSEILQLCMQGLSDNGAASDDWSMGAPLNRGSVAEDVLCRHCCSEVFRCTTYAALSGYDDRRVDQSPERRQMAAISYCLNRVCISKMKEGHPQPKGEKLSADRQPHTRSTLWRTN